MNYKLERCPVCGGEVQFISCDPPLERPGCNGKYSLWCCNCELLFGYDVDYGCQFVKKEEVAEEWNKGYAFRYKHMWERLRKELPALKQRVNMSGLTRQGVFDNIAEYMDYIEETADREEEP